MKHSEITTEDETKFEIKYYSIPGSTFSDWIAFPSELHQCVQWKPDFVVVCLGGNSIVDSVSDYELQDRCKRFYSVLRHFLPNSILIATQVELRFVKSKDRHGTPSVEEFAKRRNKFNRFLRTFQGKDFLATIGGKGCLDNSKYYRDSYHLTKEGLYIYFDCLINTVKFAKKNPKPEPKPKRNVASRLTVPKK